MDSKIKIDAIDKLLIFVLALIIVIVCYSYAVLLFAV